MSHLLISAAHKSSGKTTITLGLCSTLVERGRRVQSFKKGPDYIDPMWLSRATGRACHNLDFNTMGHDEIVSDFLRHSQGSDVGIIEGNHGLFDSFDVQGENSNASLAKLLRAPVLLVLDVHGATRSIVPLILGFQQFDPDVRIGGLILSKVAGTRHERRLREVVEYYTDIPLLGAIHRDARLVIDERHLGLIPSNEANQVDKKLMMIRELIGNQVDIDKVEQLAMAATLPATPAEAELQTPQFPRPDLRIGIARDAAFGFYYPSDLEQLRLAGAELVEIDTLHDKSLPQLDGLFIGGGFPETHMHALEANSELRQSIRLAVEAGLPCYAECGGLMYLSRSIKWGEERAEMVGIIPGDSVMHERPQGRGYMRLKENSNSPWPGAPADSEVKAHEFHYSSLDNMASGHRFAYDVLRGMGIDGSHDGFVYKNLLASYVHMRDVEGNRWARRFVEFVRSCRTTAAAGL